MTTEQTATRNLFGWIPDLPDSRDALYRDLRPGYLMKMLRRPATAYLHEDNFTEVVNQGSIGSCVGHGVTNVCGYVIDKRESPRDGVRPAQLSRLFAYWVARRDKLHDTGAYIRDGVKAIAQYGIPEECHWPYEESQFARKPSQAAFVAGEHRKVGMLYFRITMVSDVLDCLAQGYPIVYGMTLFDSFERIGRDGIVPMPKETEGVIGGHCMAIIGYSLKRRACYVRNSWGKGWGERGHCWVPFDYLEAYADDLWTVRRLGT